MCILLHIVGPFYSSSRSLRVLCIKFHSLIKYWLKELSLPDYCRIFPFHTTTVRFSPASALADSKISFSAQLIFSSHHGAATLILSIADTTTAALLLWHTTVV